MCQDQLDSLGEWSYAAEQCMPLDCTRTLGQTSPSASVSQGTLHWWLQLGRRLWGGGEGGEEIGKEGERRKGGGRGGDREGMGGDREGKGRKGKRREWGECI